MNNCQCHPVESPLVFYYHGKGGGGRGEVKQTKARKSVNNFFTLKPQGWHEYIIQHYGC